MMVALREFKPSSLQTSGFLIDLNLEAIAARSWSIFPAKNVEAYQNYFLRGPRLHISQTREVFILLFM